MRKLLFTLLLTCLFGMARGQTAFYWFDNQSVVTTAPTANGAFDADASALSDGLHTLHVQYMAADGKCAPAMQRFFLRASEAEAIGQITMLCGVDGELHSHQVVTVTDGLASCNIDLANVAEGLHSITIQAITQSGEMTSSYNGFFLRVVEPTPQTLRCSYMIDDDTTLRDMGIVEQGGTVHFDLDASALSDGLHSITYLLYDEQGGTSMTKRYFVKIPDGGNKLTKYQLWVNDNVDQMRTTTLAEHQNPLTVTDLIEVEQCPLRSQLFHFGFDADDTPTMYAKNILKGHFYDRTGHFATIEESYVDYSVSQAVAITGGLTSGEKVTTAWPADNTVTWYVLNATKGDSLRLKLSCAATVQLFSPSGIEVYHADGAKAVNWGGLHAAESGTFYLALHDVTAKKGNTVSIDYQLIDRYAVLGKDVSAVGNGGPSTITFTGNGFDDLVSVQLSKTSPEYYVSSTKVQANGKAEAAVTFDFKGASTGTYDAVFHFTDGNVAKAHFLTVEKAVPTSYKTTASYASRFLLARGNDYRFRVTNHGNMSVYDVPMTLEIYTLGTASLRNISANGCTLGRYTESTSSTDIEGYPCKRTYQLTKTLRPGETEQLIIHVETTETVYVYLTAGGMQAGGPSTPVASIDPNDIYGYQDKNGDKTIPGGLTQVYYTIEFENDPEFATAPAHDIYVEDVLDPELFDISTFAPTSVRIGAQEVLLDGSQSGSVTFSMMPDIYAIAQLDWEIDATTGKVSWHISSLDPLTVEPTEVVDNGVLPVNDNSGCGIGQLSFDIQLKPGLADGTEIPNYATITFDENSPITTPTWKNVIQGVLTGDVNGDGAVTAQDASLVQQLVAKKVASTTNGIIYKAADVNGDGAVTAQDASLIQQHVAKKIDLSAISY